MKKLLLAFLLCFASSASEASFNQTWCTHTLGYQQLTSLTGSTAFTSVPAGTIYAVVSVETQAIRWRDDGVAPTASVGMPVAAGSSFAYTTNFIGFRIIQQAASATVDVYFCGP
jgi:hypothetical protein